MKPEVAESRQTVHGKQAVGLGNNAMGELNKMRPLRTGSPINPEKKSSLENGWLQHWLIEHTCKLFCEGWFPINVLLVWHVFKKSA